MILILHNKIDFHKHTFISHTTKHKIMEPDIIYTQITNDLIQCKNVHNELDKISEKLGIVEELIREKLAIVDISPPKKKQKII